MKRIDYINCNGDIREHIVRDPSKPSYRRRRVIEEAWMRTLCGIGIIEAEGCSGGWQQPAGNLPCRHCDKLAQKLAAKHAVMAGAA